MATALSSHELWQVIHHVFLPPKLPQESDENSNVSFNLLQVTMEALEKLSDSKSPAIERAIAAIQNLMNVNCLKASTASEPHLHETLNALASGDCMPVFVGSQNAAVLVTRMEDELLFEAFELSAPNSAVMSAKGRLVRSFPGLALTVDTKVHYTSDLGPVIAQTLSTMSSENVAGMQPETMKSGIKHEEFRDTTNPALVTELFFGFLKGFGRPAEVTAITKNTRDEVLWKDALAPWRRSPTWLLIKLVLQLVIQRSPRGSERCFKEVMVFLLSHILDAATDSALPSDTLHAMSAKVTRRLHKLRVQEASECDALLAKADKSLKNTSTVIRLRWKKLEERDDRTLDLESLEALDAEQDTHILLPNLDGYISSLQLRKGEIVSNKFVPSSLLLSHEFYKLPPLPDRLPLEYHYATANLQQFETWVAQHLDSWVGCHAVRCSDPCTSLFQLMKRYFELANRHYSPNPEGISVMILTVFDLWVACDKLATRTCPMLAEYAPNVPVEALQNLLLPFQAQMKRLQAIEDHLKGRAVRSRNELANCLFNTTDPKCFAARYFSTSDEHQALKSQIERKAKAAAEAKKAEYLEKKKEWDYLNARYNSHDHDYESRKILDSFGQWVPATPIHVRACRKCAYKSRRDSIVIEQHEWPLPKSAVKANVVVFELQVPIWYISWRDARQFLLVNVLKAKKSSAHFKFEYRPSTNDPHLKPWFKTGMSAEIGLLSVKKPTICTHFNSTEVDDEQLRGKPMTSVTAHTVCVANGLDYEYFDDTRRQYLEALSFDDEVPKSCTYTISSKKLQHYLFRPARFPDGEAPNDVIAAQNRCPSTMVLDEFKELYTLLLGHHIQWVNVLQQLAMPGVDFKKSDTTLFFFQCIYQAGPPGKDALRESHLLFRDDSMALELIDKLDAAVESVKQNWESAQALYLFAAIATRVLTLNREAQNASLSVLTKVRSISFGWIETLRAAAHTVSNHEERALLMTKCVEVALICASTYDVETKHLEEMLSLLDNVSMLIQASITVQEGAGDYSLQAADICLLRLRFSRLMHRCCVFLTQCSAGLDDAVQRSWSAYTPGNECWSVASQKTPDWMTTETYSRNGDCNEVHLNLLSGELLVDGVPLDNLPHEYRDQPTYKTLFGASPVEVMPTARRDFHFSTKRLFGEYSVDIGLRPGSSRAATELLVRGSNTTGSIQTVPEPLLANVFPEHFSRDYVHWFNFATGEVEFRPTDDPWNSKSKGTWTLKRVQGPYWQLSKDGNAVVGLNTATSRVVGGLLHSIAKADRVHCIWQSDSQTLKIDIPAIRLGFSLSNGTSCLQSKEFPSFAISRDQSLGTLIGYRNRLLLESRTGDRLLLLAESNIEYYDQRGQMSVEIKDLNSVEKLHALRVDDQLHRLLDNGDLGCKLYLAYLHALTSFCLPDTFTKTTGTEQALTILESCAVRSFSQLSQAEIDKLTLIARLSPGRSLYPAGMRVMQSVSWNPKLSFFAQNGCLRTIVQAIFDQAKDAQIFHPDSVLSFPTLLQCDEMLQLRDDIRSSTFKVPGFGAEDHTRQFDELYTPRGRPSDSAQGQNAALMTSLVVQDGEKRLWRVPYLDRVWKMLVNISEIHGTNKLLVDQDYRYNGVLTQSSAFTGVLADFPFHCKKLAQNRTSAGRYQAAIWLATMAFAENANLDLLQLFVVSLKSELLADFEWPSVHTYNLSLGNEHRKKEIQMAVESCIYDISKCSELTALRGPRERADEYEARCKRIWRHARNSAVSQVVYGLSEQFPCPASDLEAKPEFEDCKGYVDVEKAMKIVQRIFQTWYDNKLLRNSVNYLVRALNALRTGTVVLPSLSVPTVSARASVPGHYAFNNLFSGPSPDLEQADCPPQLASNQLLAKDSPKEAQPSSVESLIEAFNGFAESTKYEQKYASDLRASLEALHQQSSGQPSEVIIDMRLFETYLDQCKSNVCRIYEAIVQSIHRLPNATTEQRVQHWPRVSPIFLLRQLAHDRVQDLPDAWKRSIVDYGLAINELQRAQRLVRFAANRQSVELHSELQNSGHKKWDPYNHPDSLLIEIESGIMIREVQEQIASEMLLPSSASNAVMQLNMGEGKSTTIIPMVASALADGSKLVRIVVARPQSKQMAQMLIAKFGGLVGRRIYHMPFSRSLNFDKAAVETVARILKQCMQTGGMLLVQPEHILSFRLMAPEFSIAGKEAVGRELMAVQDFFDQHSRDIVDESDENFTVHFELIYTMGTQKSIEMSPNRWFLIQQILALAKCIAFEILREMPSAIEVHTCEPGAFPRVRLLQHEASTMLVDRIARYIRDHGLEGLQLSRQSQDQRDAIFGYITSLDLDDETVRMVEGDVSWDLLKSPLLFLRGILAGGVLAFTLSQKRWRVNYGLASRSPPTKLAVPYRAKDSPSLRSEFSHPDVVIILTSLCYYYSGLSDEDMFTAFQHLINSDQATAEYQVWIKASPGIPIAYQQLQGINLKDQLQCTTKVFPHLCKVKSVIDYFLSHNVFPKEMREFPLKLSASGWDVGKKKKHLTTGFSGTNDSKHVLPLHVQQLDLQGQKHTNALVLEYLLEPINTIELMEPVKKGMTDADHLLATVLELDPPVQVILDVGAQILEYDNLGLAKEWLRMSAPVKEAAVFVNDSDEICVVDRKGCVDLLQTSPFASRLDACLVFLDESHTRGIDLKLPSDYRAAVTLGARLTKDRLVQACMRMRKLGKGQSVVFCVSQEIQAKISAMKRGKTTDQMSVADVLLWSISETSSETRRSMPLWAVQGERFVRHAKIWQDMKKKEKTVLTKAGAQKLLEEEAHSLDHRYRPRKTDEAPSQLAEPTDLDTQRIVERCREFDNLQFTTGALQEEQERELAPEVERQRQVQRTQPAKPIDHVLHNDVVAFALRGELIQNSKAYTPAFESLDETSAASEMPPRQLCGERKLLATFDFATTVEKTGRTFSADSFRRHVNWIITKRATSTSHIVEYIMIISEYEANLLLPRMKTNSLTSLHKYKAKVNAGYDALDELRLFTWPPQPKQSKLVVPRSLRIQLNLFAGQLYIDSYDDYLEICKFLGIWPEISSQEMHDQGWKFGGDGFILSDAQGNIGGSSGLSKSPIPFFKILMSKIRRNGEGISKTDMGRLLEGAHFEAADWED